jgi:hypothetical protein
MKVYAIRKRGTELYGTATYGAFEKLSGSTYLNSTRERACSHIEDEQKKIYELTGELARLEIVCFELVEVDPC